MLNRGRLLLGAFDNADQAVSFVSRVATTPAEWIRGQWPRRREAFLAAPNNNLQSAATNLEPATLRVLNERMNAQLFRQSLNGHCWRLANVPLAALVTAQPLIDLTRLEAMAEKLREGMVPALFPLQTTISVKTKASDGPTIALIADRGELAVTAADARRDAMTGAVQITFRIEPRPNYVSVLEDHGRLFVRNGNHRLLAAWQTNVRVVPCVLFDRDTAELARERWDRFPEPSLAGARPPRLVDLAEPGDACVELELRRRQFVTSVRAEQQSSYED